MKWEVARSTNGTYHRALGNTPPCNARSMSVNTITAEMIEGANENMFCKKCFNTKDHESRKAHAIKTVSA